MCNQKELLEEQKAGRRSRQMTHRKGCRAALSVSIVLPGQMNATGDVTYATKVTGDFAISA
jgi:hypothetical protein